MHLHPHRNDLKALTHASKNYSYTLLKMFLSNIAENTSILNITGLWSFIYSQSLILPLKPDIGMLALNVSVGSLSIGEHLFPRCLYLSYFVF